MNELASFDNWQNFNAEFISEISVTFVVRWHTHDRPSTISCQHVVSNINRYFGLIHRVYCIESNKDTCFLCLSNSALFFCFMGGFVKIFFDLWSMVFWNDLEKLQLFKLLWRKH